MAAFSVVLGAVLQSLGADAQERGKLQFVLTGIVDARQAAKSARFQITGDSTTVDFQNPDNSLQGPFKVRGAFDANGRLRFDRSEPGWTIDTAASQATADGSQSVVAGGKKGLVESRLFRTSKRTGFWQVGQPLINLAGPDYDARAAGAFDLRALGLYSWVEFDRGTSLEDLIQGYLKKEPPPRIDDSEERRWTITWITEGGPLTSRWEIVVDVAQGFTPVKAVQSSRPRESSANDGWEIIQETETRWNRINSVWLPVHHRLSLSPGKDSFKRLITFDVAWTDVNEKLPDDLFDYTTFGAPNTVGVVDSSLGPTVIIKSPELPPGVPRPRGAPENATTVGYWIICLSLLVLGVLLALFALGKSRSARA